LVALLKSEKRFADLRFLRGVPELVTPLPVNGEGRNHDLWLLGRTHRESVTICIEAKADEPFGNRTVSGHRAWAIRRRNSRNRRIPSRVPERIDALLAIIGHPFSKWADIRYQLLTGLCGTVLQAQADLSGCGAFVVHEFHTCKTTPKKLHRNNQDYEAFLAVFSDRAQRPASGSLFGPVRIGGIDCFLGKAVRQIGETAKPVA
jgi:hypothetical protein